MSSPFLQECKGAIPFLILYLQYAKANSSEDNVKHVIKAACSHLQIGQKVRRFLVMAFRAFT